MTGVWEGLTHGHQKVSAAPNIDGAEWATPAEATKMYREGKTSDELRALILAEIHEQGFSAVRDVQIYRVTDLRADFNWSMGPIALGNEDDKAVTRAMGLLLRRLQDRCELMD